MTNEGYELLKEIKEYIDANGGSYQNWYVGISKNPEKRLYQEHNVDKIFDLWIFGQATTSDEARQIEYYFTHTLNTDGDSGGGDVLSTSVYAYRKTVSTKQ